MSHVIYYVPIIGVPLDYRRGQFALKAAVSLPQPSDHEQEEKYVGMFLDENDPYYPTSCPQIIKKCSRPQPSSINPLPKYGPLHYLERYTR